MIRVQYWGGGDNTVREILESTQVPAAMDERAELWLEMLRAQWGLGSNSPCPSPTERRWSQLLPVPPSTEPCWPFLSSTGRATARIFESDRRIVATCGGPEVASREPFSIRHAWLPSIANLHILSDILPGRTRRSRRGCPCPATDGSAGIRHAGLQYGHRAKPHRSNCHRHRVRVIPSTAH